jgi:hypothetical protein
VPKFINMAWKKNGHIVKKTIWYENVFYFFHNALQYRDVYLWKRYRPESSVTKYELRTHIIEMEVLNVPIYLPTGGHGEFKSPARCDGTSLQRPCSYQ